MCLRTRAAGGSTRSRPLVFPSRSPCPSAGVGRAPPGHLYTFHPRTWDTQGRRRSSASDGDLLRRARETDARLRGGRTSTHMALTQILIKSRLIVRGGEVCRQQGTFRRAGDKMRERAGLGRRRAQTGNLVQNSEIEAVLYTGYI